MAGKGDKPRPENYKRVQETLIRLYGEKKLNIMSKKDREKLR